MSYCNQTDIENEFSNEELARLTGDSSGSVIDIDRINLAISTSKAIIDAYLTKRIEVEELTAENQLINRIAVTLAISTLYEIEYKVMMIPESILMRKSNAIKLLKMLTQGVMLLKNSSTNNYIISNKTIEDRSFTREILDQFMEK